MHLYSRAVGMKSLSSRQSFNRVVQGMIDKALVSHRVIYNPDEASTDGYYEAQINAVTLPQELGGIVIRGLYNPALDKFHKLFTYPYIAGTHPRYCYEAHIERQSDKEAYMVYCNDTNRELSPIFFLSNIVDYLRAKNKIEENASQMVFMSAMALSGHVIMPVKKTQAQVAKVDAAIKQHEKLVDRALQGDQEAVDQLKIEDYDILAKVSRRVHQEDIYSIVDSAFIPSGLECDAYSVVGNILEVQSVHNLITDEEVYVMSLECNDVIFNLGIHKDDLLGVPQVGYRFVGKIWLQGSLAT